MATLKITLTIQVGPIGKREIGDFVECVEAALGHEDFWNEALAGSDILAKVGTVTASLAAPS